MTLLQVLDQWACQPCGKGKGSKGLSMALKSEPCQTSCLGKGVVRGEKSILEFRKKPKST